MKTGSLTIDHPIIGNYRFTGTIKTFSGPDLDHIRTPWQPYRNSLPNEDLVSQSITPLTYVKPIEGCTDPSAMNYNPNATSDNGSCKYPFPGCTNPAATNYNPDATVDDGTCIIPIWGCTDPAYIEFNPDATHNLPQGQGIANACNITLVEQAAADALAQYQADLALVTANLTTQKIPLKRGHTELVSTYVDTTTFKTKHDNEFYGRTDWKSILQNFLSIGQSAQPVYNGNPARIFDFIEYV